MCRATYRGFKSLILRHHHHNDGVLAATVHRSQILRFRAIAPGFSLLLAGIAYWILQTAIIRTHGHDSTLKEAIGRNFKGKMSPILNSIAIIFAFSLPLTSYFLFASIALMLIIPDRKIAQDI